MNATQDDLSLLISTCRSEDDMNYKISLFNLIREIISDRTGKEMKAPSLLTNDLINSTLDRIRS